jgi:hypothetical protein
MSEDPKTLRAAERDTATETIARALNQGRELDDWQKAHICSAVGSVYCGLYRLAQTEAHLAMVPPQGHVPFTADAQTQGLTRDTLTVALREVAGLPLRLSPVFRLAA